jgi:hypothetical protein
MTFRTCTKWTAYVFGVLAALSIISSAWAIWQSNRVLSWPIHFSSDFRLQQDFRVWRKADYRISVYCFASADQEHLKKLLQGGNLVQITLGENGSAVSLYLFPEPRFRPGIVSTDEFGNIVLGGDKVGQDIADFAGDPAKYYTITCSAIRSAPELDQMHPKLTIALDPLEGKSDMGLILLLWLAAAVSAIVALVAAIIYASIRKKQPNQSSLEPNAGRCTERLKNEL